MTALRGTAYCATVHANLRRTHDVFTHTKDWAMLSSLLCSPKCGGAAPTSCTSACPQRDNDWLVRATVQPPRRTFITLPPRPCSISAKYVAQRRYLPAVPVAHERGWVHHDPQEPAKVDGQLDWGSVRRRMCAHRLFHFHRILRVCARAHAHCWAHKVCALVSVVLTKPGA